MEHLKASAPSILVECLTPNFGGHESMVHRVARSGLDVYAHNVETVERLQGRVRDRRAGYAQSLRVLEAAKEAQPGLVTKTSIMLGCGEREEEVQQTLRDLRTAGCDVVTLGQYLRPSKGHMPIHRYVEPSEFDRLREEAEGMGFAYVASGPLVRSSYRAGGLCRRAARGDTPPWPPLTLVTVRARRRVFHEVYAPGEVGPMHSDSATHPLAPSHRRPQRRECGSSCRAPVSGVTAKRQQPLHARARSSRDG